jgi:predicted site-specific integrase-resolvase
MSEEIPKLYTTQQAAQELGVSDSLLRIMIRKGTAHPNQKIGNSWVFTLDEIERLRHRNRKTGPAKKQANA